LINDSHLVDKNGFYLKKAPQKSSGLPYPNPVKLERKQEKGDYLSAELMRQGIALQMTDIRPNTKIESEIFPKELSKVNGPEGHNY